MIRWILLDREIDDTATARGRGKEGKDGGEAEVTGTGRGTGGNKSSGEKRGELSKNKRETEENPQSDKRGA